MMWIYRWMKKNTTLIRILVYQILIVIGEILWVLIWSMDDNAFDNTNNLSLKNIYPYWMTVAVTATKKLWTVRKNKINRTLRKVKYETTCRYLEDLVCTECASWTLWWNQTSMAVTWLTIAHGELCLFSFHGHTSNKKTEIELVTWEGTQIT